MENNKRSVLDYLESIEKELQETKEKLYKKANEESNNNNFFVEQNEAMSKDQTNNDPTIGDINRNQDIKNSTSVLLDFLKNSSKSYMFFGSKAKFFKYKFGYIAILLLCIAFGILMIVYTTLSLKKLYFTSIFESIWVGVFCIIEIVYVISKGRTCPKEKLSKYTPYKSHNNRIDDLVFDGEKTIFSVFRILCIISVICNVVLVFTISKSDNEIVVMIASALFFISILYVYVMKNKFYHKYTIVFYEGKNLDGQDLMLVYFPPRYEPLTLEQFKEECKYSGIE